MQTEDARLRWLGPSLIGLAVALAVLAIAGPLTGAIQWRIRPLIRDQLYGLDALSLPVVAPLAATAGILALRDRPIGALLGFPPAAYAVYMVPQYVLGPDYSHIAGDNERWFPLLLALFALGVVGASLSWTVLASHQPAGAPARERVVDRWLLPIAAFVLFTRYIPALTDWMSPTPTAKDYVAGPNFGWTIALLDLGIALPATIAVCVGYRRGATWSRRGLYALTGWFALVGSAVAAMAVAMQIRSDPAMSLAQMATMSVLGAILAAVATALYLPALRRGRPSTMPPARPAGHASAIAARR